MRKISHVYNQTDKEIFINLLVKKKDKQYQSFVVNFPHDKKTIDKSKASYIIAKVCFLEHFENKFVSAFDAYQSFTSKILFL